jgi:hypothetical protein
MTYVVEYKNVADEKYLNDINNEEALGFEKLLVKIFDGKFFRQTLFEYDRKLTPEEEEKLLKFLLQKPDEVNGMTRHEIFAKMIE